MTKASLSQSPMRLWVRALGYLVWRRQADMYCGVDRRVPVRRLHMCFCPWLLFFRYRNHKHRRRLGKARGAVACAFPLLLYKLVTYNQQDEPENQQRNPEGEDDCYCTCRRQKGAKEMKPKHAETRRNTHSNERYKMFMAAPVCKTAVTTEEDEEVSSVRRCMVRNLKTFHTFIRL